MKKYLLLFISMFLIAGTINSQQLVSPGGDAVDISFSASSITFNWDAYSFTNTVGGDDYYVLHLGTSTGVYPLNTGTSAGTSNSLAVSHTYDYNTVYYWQVTVVQDGGLVYTYPEKKFKTAMANPSISSPVNGATYTIWTVPSQVEWTLAANNTGVTYDLDYSGNSLSTGVTSPANGAGYSSTGSKSYTVHAIDDNSVLDNTNSSSTTSFTLNGVLTIPVISITGQSVLPTFKFDQFGSVTDYTLEIGTASGGPYTTRVVALSASNTTIAANEVTYYAKDDEMDPLTNATWYYWRVKVADGNVAGGFRYSEESYFKTDEDVTVTLSYPEADQEVYAFDDLNLYWFISEATGTMRYRVEILENPGSVPTQYDALWNTPDFSAQDISGLTTEIAGLKGAATYYWRVVVYYDENTSNTYNDGDRTVKISSVGKFTTKGGAVEAYPSWPITNPTIYSANPFLYWYHLEYSSNLEYTVYVATANDGDLSDNGSWVYSATVTDLFDQVTVNLASGTPYYWQVKTTYTVDNSFVLSSVESFTTDAWDAVTAFLPTASYPVDGVDIYSTAPYLWWYVGGVYDNLTFQVILEESDGVGGWTDVSGTNLTATTTTDLNIQATGLTPGVTYRWSVRSYETGNSGNTSLYTATEEFTVVGGALTSTVTTWPTSGEVVYTINPTAYWYLEGSHLGVTGYTFKYSTNNQAGSWHSYSPGAASPTSGSLTVTGYENTSYTFTQDLNYGQIYYWAVATSENDDENGDYSTGSFVVAGGSSNVTLVKTTPEDESIVYGDEATLYWYASGSTMGITGYRVVYSDTKLFVESPDHVYESAIGIATNATITDLNPGTTYYWYPQFTYDATPTQGGTWYPSTGSGIAGAFEFTVVAGAAPVVPQPASPINGLTLGEGNVSLSWRLPVQSESTLNYDVQLATNADFTDAQEFADVDALNAKVNSLGAGEYFWRVRSKVKNTKGADASEYSTAGNFNIQGVTSAKEEEQLPTEFELAQNYPNPFNPTTSIKFSLPQAEYVSITVYDMLGNEIRTLVNREVAAGTHSAVWNGNDNFGSRVASGTYIYRISAGEFVSVKKMLLLK